MKRYLKWSLAFCAILVLMLGLLAGCGEKETAAEKVELYYNIDCEHYMGAPGIAPVRRIESDGYYHIRFAHNGEQERLPVAQEVLKKGLDFYRIVNLVFDENGVVVDFNRVDECTGGYFVDEFFVETIDGSTVTCNAASTYLGYQKTFELPEDANVYYVLGDGPLVGMKTTINIDDQITAVMDKNGKVTDCFVKPLEEVPQVYFNATRMYNTTTKKTTRESDLTGTYVFEMAFNGGPVTVKTKSEDIASKMDSLAARNMELTFDEDGYVDSVVNGDTLNGNWSSWCNVFSVKDGEIETVRSLTGSNLGMKYRARMARNFVAYDVNPYAEPYGAVTELRKGDTVHCLKNSRGQIVIAFVVNRKMDGEVYWNVTRMYNATTKETTRTPNEEGWYELLMTTRGEQFTLKTKDKALVTKIDARADKHCGLVVEDGIIKEFYTPADITGGGAFASWYDVMDIAADGKKIGALRTYSTNIGTYVAAVLADDCKVYDVSGMGSFVGEPTEIRMHDRIHGELNDEGKLGIVYVVRRLADSDMYWNVERKYNETTKSTTRGKWSDGYYRVVLAVNGKQATYKVADKEVMNSIDKRPYLRSFGVTLEGDVITRVHEPALVTGGGGFASWADITSIKDGVITAVKVTDSETQALGTVYTAKMAEDCEVYDVTDLAKLDSYIGVKTTPRVGDRIYGHLNLDGEIQVLYIVGNRLAKGYLVWNVERQYDSTNKVSKREPDADGWYKVLLAVNGKQVTWKTKDKETIDKIDAAYYMGLTVNKDGVIQGYYPYNLITGGYVLASSSYVTRISGSTITIEKPASGTTPKKTYTARMTSNCKVYNVSDSYVNFIGEETKLKVGDRVAAIKGSNGRDVCVIYVSYRPDIAGEPDHFHCHCGDGSANGIGEHVCDESFGWSAWTNPRKLPTSGNWYLATDVNLKSGYTVAAGTTLNLCLNGHTVNGSETARIYYSAGNMTVTDCKPADQQGQMISNANESAGVIYAGVSEAGSSLNIFAGTFKSSLEQATKSGPVLFAGNNMAGTAQINIYGGTFQGVKTSGNGSAAYFMRGTTVNIYGGSFTGIGNCVYASGDALNIFDGAISGGSVIVTAGKAAITGGTVSGGLDLRSAVVAEISGAPVIAGGTDYNLKLANNEKVTLGDFTDGAEIYVRSTVLNVPFGTLTDPADKAYFFCDDEDAVLQVTAENQILLKAKHTHCVCGASASDGVGEHTCNDTVGWVKWTDGTKLPTTSGNYYLDTDVTMTASQSISASVTINLCLNGHTGYGPETSWGIYTAGNMSVTDCKPAGQQGQMVGRSNSSGSVFYAGVSEAGSSLNIYAGTFRSSLAQMSKSGTVLFSGNNMAGTAVTNIYGGTLQGTKNSAAGGTVYLMRGATLNMYGGTITGGESTGNGGNVRVATSAAMNLYGGTVSGGKAAQGGNINVDSGELTISGGTITGGTVALANCQATVTGGNISGGLYQLSTAALTLSGKPVISGLTVSDGTKITVGDMTEGAAITMTLSQAGDKVGPLTDPEDKVFFTSADEDNELLMDEENKLYQQVKAHTHCVCGSGDFAGVGGHTCDDSAVWTKWTDGTKLPTASGYYYLDTDVTLTTILTIPVDNHVRLCFNGHTVTGPTNNYMLMIRGHVTTTDCNELSKQGGMVARYDVGGAVAYISDVNGSGDSAVGVHTSMTIYAGTYRNTVAAMTKSGGVFFMGGKDLGGSSVLNLYGGTIYGAKTSANGGAIYTCWDSTVNLYGGTITGGNAATGGNIYAGGTGGVNMYGGTVTGGTATTGGNIYIKNLSATISGGTVSDGVAVNGGNIYFDGDTATVFTLTLSGGTVSGGRAVHEGYPTAKNGTALIYPIGGNISVNGNEKLLITGATVRDGVASHAGGNIALNATSDLEVSGGQILGGTAAYGGNIFTNNDAAVQVKISGGKISGGTLDRSKVAGTGRCIRLHTKAKLTLEGKPEVEEITFVTSNSNTTATTKIDATGMQSLEKPIKICLNATTHTNFVFADVDEDLSGSFLLSAIYWDATNKAESYNAAKGHAVYNAETKTLSAVIHATQVVAAEAATCTEAGHGEYRKCTVCDYKANIPVIPALNHDWDEGTVTTPPTSEAAGEKTFTCKREGCGETKTEPVEKLETE